MSLRDQTKRLFADTLVEMMRSEPLEKIRVKAICERCGAERQSFYYHFRDKYDLVAWIFMQDYTAALDKAGGIPGEEQLAAVLRAIWNKQAFYRKAFSDRSQNAIGRYIFDYFVAMDTEAVKRIRGGQEPDAETLYAIKSHNFASLGHTIEWLDGRENYSPEEFAHLQFAFMPDVTKRAYGLQEQTPTRP